MAEIGRYESPNHDARPDGAAIDMVVLHYSGMETADAALARLCDPAAKVSAHYLIDEDGAVRRLVAEERRAWHAGAACWRGVRDVNGRSLGIELVNPGHEFGYRPFAEAQMAALEDLARDILARHPIEARNVVGHSDVAPRRKMDPGELFDWPRLAAAGIGLWPASAPADEADADEDEAKAMLADFGYETGDLGMTVTAFQRHFRPRRVDGTMDGDTAGRLRGLLKLCR
ncbi:MAG: N-acetylmuramoyl-L-alanine amidase [Proteobacteria bacterium]|nr:N-acetylmuramoyl-L-alanine amidase [Pseudomonadota bacterium]MCH7957249.1 N-acetylmuramoyl-L-alanine amidase [Pseudomonadota bacterium]